MKLNFNLAYDIDDRIIKLINVINNTGFVSYDPFDGLNAPWLFYLAKKNKTIGRIIVQIVKRSPINLRRVLCIKQTPNDPKAIADVIQAFIYLYKANPGNEYYLNKATFYAKYLVFSAIKDINGVSWGLKFPFSSRYTFSNDCPNLFTTVNVASAFCELYESTGDKEYLNILNHINSFLFNTLGIIKTKENGSCFRYYPELDIPVYNVNSLALKYLCKYCKIINDNKYNKNIIKLVEFLITGQNDDGSWFYSETDKGKWIDGFHTGYIIEGLIYYYKFSNDDKVLGYIKKAANYYFSELFKENMPLYYPRKKFPIDSQNCAQALQTRVLLYEIGLDNIESILLMLKKIDDGLKSSSGYYYYQKKYLYTNKTLFLRWSLTPFLLAMSHLKISLDRYND